MLEPHWARKAWEVEHGRWAWISGPCLQSPKTCRHTDASIAGQQRWPRIADGAGVCFRGKKRAADRASSPTACAGR